MGKKSKKKISNSAVILFAVLLIAAAVFSAVSIKNSGKKYTDDDASTVNNTVNETDEITSDAANPSVRHNMTDMKKADMYSGGLLLIDNNHEYKFADKTDGIVSVQDYKNEKYYVLDRKVLLRYEAIEAFNELSQSYNDAVLAYKDEVSKAMIKSGYRSEAKQSSMYQSGESPFKPKCSENHTGLAFDLANYYDGVVHDYDGKNDFEWINKNCYKYGFIVSFKATKAYATEVGGQPYHFRYVGIPHSYAMEENNFCMSEYLEFLKNYSLENPYTITVKDETYQIYYSPYGDIEEQNVQIPIPTDFQYSVSGNNYDGFIITVKGEYTKSSDNPS